MRATDPTVTFLLVLIIGIVAGVLFDRLAGPSWLARQFSGSTRGIITSRLLKKFNARSILSIFWKVGGDPKDVDAAIGGYLGYFSLIFGTPDGLIPLRR